MRTKILEAEYFTHSWELPTRENLEAMNIGQNIYSSEALKKKKIMCGMFSCWGHQLSIMSDTHRLPLRNNLLRHSGELGHHVQEDTGGASRVDARVQHGPLQLIHCHQKGLENTRMSRWRAGEREKEREREQARATK